MKTVIEMAREVAGDDWTLFRDFLPEIHRLAELVRADEREAIIKIADDLQYWDDSEQLIKAIRARSNT